MIAEGVSIGTTKTDGVGGDLGNEPITKSTNTDNPMNNNSYLNLEKVLLFNIIFASFESSNPQETYFSHNANDP